MAVIAAVAGLAQPARASDVAVEAGRTGAAELRGQLLPLFTIPPLRIPDIPPAPMISYVEGHYFKIHQSVATKGLATVSVILRLDALEWGLGVRGDAVFRWTPALEDEFREKARAFLESLPAAAVLNLEEAKRSVAAGLPPLPAARTNPAIALVINHKGWLALQLHQDIRAISMADTPLPPIQLDDRVLVTARRDGGASVLINLKTPQGYSPVQGRMSKHVWMVQQESLRSALVEIIGRADPQAPALAVLFGPSARVVLPLEALRRNYGDPDPRI
ncbi:MAG: hypothetical protein ABI409_08605, partial [Ramlibacter sp.]